MDTKQNMLIKVASLDKSAGLVARISFTNSMAKVAKKAAIQDYTEKLSMNKQADLGQSLNDAWKGVQDWWANDANKAGLATGALGGLATYGLTGLIPGLKNNQLARLGLAAGGAYGGYKGGQWGANQMFGKGFDNAKEIADAREKALKEKHQGDIDQLNATIARGSEGLNAANAEIGNLTTQLTDVQGQLDAANSSIASLSSELETARTSGNVQAYNAIKAQLDEAIAARDAASAKVSELSPIADAYLDPRNQKARELGATEYYKDLVKQNTPGLVLTPDEATALKGNIQKGLGAPGMAYTPEQQKIIQKAYDTIDSRVQSGLISANSEEAKAAQAEIAKAQAALTQLDAIEGLDPKAKEAQKKALEAKIRALKAKTERRDAIRPGMGGFGM